MNRYQLIRGFDTEPEAQSYADGLPVEARARVIPYRDGRKFLFAVDVHRNYVGGRL